MLLETPESHSQSEVCEACRRKAVATPAGSVAADALDVLAIAGMRAALVLLAPAPEAGVPVLLLSELLLELLLPELPFAPRPP